MVHMHYCMGELVEKNFWASEDTQCHSCGMDKSGSDSEKCCKEEVKQVKVDKEHNPAQAFVFQVLLPVETPLPLPSFSHPLISTLTEDYPLSHAPPASGTKDIYKRIRVFRI